MNLSYFRKSNFNSKKTVENLLKQAKDRGFTLLGEEELANKKGKVFSLIKKDILRNLIAADRNLIGLLPSLIVVIKDGDDVFVGCGSATILGSVTKNPAVLEVSKRADEEFKNLVNKSAGVGPLKPSKVKLYSTMSCPYCKMEKSWLDSRKVEHDVVYVDLNQKEAEKMVVKTGQMGVPVTEVEYEDSEPEFIVGFDKDRLASILSVEA